MPPLSRDTVEEDDDLESEALNEMLQKITGDKNKLTELLVRNLMKNQEKPRNNGATKLDDCPVKGKFSSLEAWLDEVELWDEASKNQSGEDEGSFSAKKYLKFMNSVKEAEDSEELKKACSGGI